MIIDSHIHLWKRDMIPNQAVRSYLEPMERFRKEYGEFFDFGVTEDKVFADFSIPLDELQEILDMNSIDKGVVLPTDFELLRDSSMGNEEYMEILFQECGCDDRLIPFISVDPNRGEAGLRMIESMVKRYAPRGIKVYPATGFFPDDDTLCRYWDLIDDLGLVVVSHTGMALPPLEEKFCHPSSLRCVAEKHPDMKIIVAHLGGKFFDELLPLMHECDNVYTDCSALQGWLPSQPDQVYDRLRTVGQVFPDRMVFGTDFPLYEVRFSAMQFIKLIRNGDWATETVKEALLGKNMARILDL